MGNVTIRRFDKSDIPNKIKWINDPRNNRYLHYDLPLEIEKTYSWFEKIKDRTDRYDAVIEYDGIEVGLIGLLSIDRGRAEYYITLGVHEYKGKGIAKKATKILLEYARDVLKLREVYLYTEVDNVLAQKLFESCHFIKSGIERGAILNRGKLVDRYYYSIVLNTNSYKLESTPLYLLFNDSDGKNEFYIKRDDLIPFSFGGNKARKAILFFEEIEKSNHDCVVTYGSSSSNHCRVIANMCALRNLPCYIIGPEEASKETFNSKMMNLFGAEITFVPVVKVHDSIEKKMLKLRRLGYNPYFIPGGGHGNIGTKAYVNCYEEIKRYEKENKIVFDYIFFASGTGTTQAGLIIGKLIYNDPTRIIGISIARKNPKGRNVVLDSINSYRKEIEIKTSSKIIDEETMFIDEYTGNKYGARSREINNTIKEALLKYGIPLDSTYTGKAFYGMKEYVKKNKIENKKILFIHTGGTPLFFDDLNEGELNVYEHTHS